jgi:hypothetical protein
MKTVPEIAMKGPRGDHCNDFFATIDVRGGKTLG